MPWKHPIDAALLCKAGTDGQLPCIDRWPMQAQGQICSITVFIIQCLPGSGKPWKDFQDKRQCWIPLHKLPTPPTFGTFADVGPFLERSQRHRARRLSGYQWTATTSDYSTTLTRGKYSE